ncbi:MAG: hypothetical protein V3S14_12030 [Anaerolineae bacterium]
MRSTEITLALFVDAVDDVNRAKYEAVYADKAPFGNGATGVTVRPVFGLFGTLRGQGIGVPNLLGVQRKEPEQVRESDTSSTQTPRDPVFVETET